MPKVPTYSPSVQTPWAPEPPAAAIGAAGLPGAALAEAGQAVQKTGDVLQNFQARLTAAKQASDYAEAKLRMREQMSDLIAELETHPDHEQIPGIFDQKSKEIYETTLKSTPDPEVQNHLKADWANLYPVQKLQVNRFSRQKMILGMAANLENQFTRSTELAAKAQTPEDATGIKADFIASLRMMSQLGVINPKQAQAMEEKFDDQVSKEKVNRLILENPQAALEALEKEDFPGLDADEKLSLIGRATANLHRRQEQNALALEKELDGDSLTVDRVRQLRDARQISPSQANYYERLLEAKGGNVLDKEDSLTAISLFDEAHQMEPGDQKRYNELREKILNPQTAIRFQNRRTLLDRINAKMVKGEKAEDTRERTQLRQYKDLLPDFFYRSFYAQYLQEREKNPGWTPEQMLENMQRISEPYMEQAAKMFPLFKPPVKPGQPEAPAAKAGEKPQAYWTDNRIFRNESWR